MTTQAILGGWAAVSSVGLNARQVATACRAGVARFREIALDDRRAEPYRLATVPDEALPEPQFEASEELGGASPYVRLLQLAGRALAELNAQIEGASKAPIFLAVPDGQPLDPGKFLRQLALQSGVRFLEASSELIRAGRAGGLVAVTSAIKYVQAYGGCAIAGGVDSFLDLQILRQLDAEERLLSNEVLDGVIPGEGAAFVGVWEASRNPSANVTPLASGLGSEPGHLGSDEPNLGKGLDQALEEVFRAASSPTATVLAGFNGESIFAKEWGIAALRHHAQFTEDIVMLHPADCFGDTGAALGALMVVLAAIGLADGHLLGPVLVWCPADGEQRAALLLDRT